MSEKMEPSGSNAFDPLAVPKAIKRKKRADGFEEPANTNAIVASIFDGVPPNEGPSASALSSNIESKVAARHVVLENPKNKPSALRQKEQKTRHREAEKKARGNAKSLTARQRKELRRASDDQATRRWRFDDFTPLHELWIGYMTELLDLSLAKPPSNPADASLPSQAWSGTPSSQAMQARLVKADFLGSRIRVEEAKNPSLKGLDGIVIEETEGTFRIITPKSQVKVLPKKHSIFAFEIPLRPASTSEAARSLAFQLHGNQFAYRSVDRVNKKFKPHFVDL